VRVRARRLHDSRGVGRRNRQEGKPRHRSSNGSRPCRSHLSFDRTAAEDLSGPPAVGRKTCPAPGGGNTERLVWWRRSFGPGSGLPRGRPLARRRNAAVRGRVSVAEADGNRTRRRAFARPPILKACPAFWYLQPCDQRRCLQAPSQNVQRLVRPIRLEDLSGGP
jgi:hypothetical protein